MWFSYGNIDLLPIAYSIWLNAQNGDIYLDLFDYVPLESFMLLIGQALYIIQD